MTDVLTPHRLTRGQFTELAAGGGSATTLDVLTGAQLSKRLLLLWALRSRALPTGADEAWSLLDRALTASPEAAHEVVRRPFVDAWATGLLRAPAPTEDAAAYLTGLAAAAAVRAGLPFELDAPAGLILPGLGRLTAPTVVIHDQNHLRVRGEDPDDSTGWQPYRQVPDPAGAAPVEIDDLDPHRAGLGLPPAERLPPAQADRLHRLHDEARTLIDDAHPKYAPTVQACLSAIVPVDAPAVGSVSSTSRSAFGAVAASMPQSGTDFALLLVHECQHAKLGALLDLVDLVDPQNNALFHAPWRTDPRPPGALLQGTYAHAAVADFWRAQRDRITGPDRRAADYEYAYWRDQTRRAADTLLGSTALTALGADFVHGLHAATDGWPTSPMDRTVDTAAVVTSVLWRLRQHRTDPATVDRLATAYAAGRPCPTPPPPVVRPAAPGSAVIEHGLVQRIRDGAAAGTLPPLTRHLPTLTERLAASPGDEEAWALLALAAPPAAAQAIRTRPDLLSAVLAALPPETRHPMEVATWLNAAVAPR